MKKILVILIATASIFSGCSSKESKPRIPEPETLKTIKKFRKGSGDQCINFQEQYLIKATEDGKPVEDLVRMFNLKIENSVQKYYFAQDLDEDRLTTAEILKTLAEDIKNNASLSGVTRAAIKALFMDYVRRNTNKMIDYMIGGLDASGAIVDKTFDFSYPIRFFPDLDFEFPIKYNIDCFDNVTSLHMQLDEFAMRMVYRENEDKTIAVDFRQTSEDGQSIEREAAILYPLDHSAVSDHPLITGKSGDEEYRTLVDSTVLRTSVNILNIRNMNHRNQVYLALYKPRTGDYIVLEPNMIFTKANGRVVSGDINLPLSALNEYRPKLRDNYNLVISSTHLKPESWRRDARYFPLGRRESVLSNSTQGIQTLAPGRSILKCLRADDCNDFLELVNVGPLPFYPSVPAAGDVEFVFQTSALPIEQVDQESLKCVDPDLSCTRFVSED